jgi:hypothetical protein
MKNFPLRIAPFNADRETGKHGEANKAVPNCFANLPKSRASLAPTSILLKLRRLIEKFPN